MSIITAYIAGPMTGIKDYNYPAFNSAARRLAPFEFNLINPAQNFIKGRPGWIDYMKLSIKQVLQSDIIITLPGWERSRGAQIEVAVAQGCFIPVVDFGLLVGMVGGE